MVSIHSLVLKAHQVAICQASSKELLRYGAPKPTTIQNGELSVLLDLLAFLFLRGCDKVGKLRKLVKVLPPLVEQRSDVLQSHLLSFILLDWLGILRRVSNDHLPVAVPLDLLNNRFDVVLVVLVDCHDDLPVLLDMGVNLTC